MYYVFLNSADGYGPRGSLSSPGGGGSGGASSGSPGGAGGGICVHVCRVDIKCGDSDSYHLRCMRVHGGWGVCVLSTSKALKWTRTLW